jgi:hypothetical protein
MVWSVLSLDSNSQLAFLPARPHPLICAVVAGELDENRPIPPHDILAEPSRSASTDQIKTTPNPHAHIYHLLVVPRMSTMCTTVLSELGVLGSIDAQEFQLGLIPLEKDVLSLEYEDVWRKLCLVRWPPVESGWERGELIASSTIAGRRLLASLRYGQGHHDDPASVRRDSSYHWQRRFRPGASVDRLTCASRPADPRFLDIETRRLAPPTSPRTCAVFARRYTPRKRNDRFHDRPGSSSRHGHPTVHSVDLRGSR